MEFIDEIKIDGKVLKGLDFAEYKSLKGCMRNDFVSLRKGLTVLFKYLRENEKSEKPMEKPEEPASVEKEPVEQPIKESTDEETKGD